MNVALKLIEQQIAKSEYRSRAEENALRLGRFVMEDGTALGPCLLISRECGSGGSLLAQQVGRHLGWNVFDAAIVDEIAQSAHVHQKLLQSVDERVWSGWERAWRDILLDDKSDEKYLRHLKQVIMVLGLHGNVVLVGRGAQYLLPPQCALRVRLYAPLEIRIERISELEKLTPKEARLKIKKVDAERNAFIWKVFRQDAAASLNYDLLINTAEFSIEKTTALVLAAMEQKLGVRSKR
ncbi:MAG TPA: cytidylate kinase-like family protein [Verrucomicrobiae bacterium]|nr:cytidylate kinase-like family protein [Verrucomicrobiae bacterium]